VGARLRDVGAGGMSKPAKPAIVRYYVDADVLGLAKILVQVRGDVTYPGDPGGSVKGGRVRAPCTITQVDTDDEIWIPETARQGGLSSPGIATSKTTGPRSKPCVPAAPVWSTWQARRPSARSPNSRSSCPSGDASQASSRKKARSFAR
jgi:hypothetical protein